LALWKYHDNIALEHVTSARILPAFMPVLVTGEAVQGKMVNFVVSPNFTANYVAPSRTSYTSNATIDAAIQNKLAMQPPSGSCSLGLIILTTLRC
jgi:hypothetical protein